MAAHACCGVVAGAAPAARRLKLRRPSRSSLMKARKLLRKAKRPRPRSEASSRRKRVVVIRRKMEALRRLVPPACRGGDELADDGRLEELLLHAAGYIMRLQMQVTVMQVMIHALNDNNPED